MKDRKTREVEIRSFPTHQHCTTTPIPWLQAIPRDWKVLPNGRLFQQRREVNSPDLPILEVSLKTGVTVRDFEDSKRKQMMTDHSLYKIARKNDIAYNTMRMWQGAVGVVPVDGLISPAYVIAKPNPETESRYYAYLFRTQIYMNEVNKYSHGIVEDRNRLYWSEFKQMPSPRPPLEEQTAIADFLDHKTSLINNFIARKKRLIKLLLEQKRVIINQAVTRGIEPDVRLKPSGVDWLGDIPEHWEVKKLKTFADFINRGVAPDYVEAGAIKVINQATFSKGYFNFSDIRYHRGVNLENNQGALQKNDILLASTGGGVLGKIALFSKKDKNCMADSHVTIIRDSKKRFIPEYIYYFLSINFDLINGRLAQGSTNQTELQREWLRSFLFPFPAISEQKKIIDHIQTLSHSLDTAITKANQEITLIKEYREALIAEAVTGKTDVRGWRKQREKAA